MFPGKEVGHANILLLLIVLEPLYSYLFTSHFNVMFSFCVEPLRTLLEMQRSSVGIQK